MAEAQEIDVTQETPASVDFPVSVMVLAILGMLFALMGGAGSLFTLIVKPAFLQEMPAGLRSWLFICAYFGVISSAWLFAQSVGLILRRGWARRGAIVYAWVVVAYDIIGKAILLATVGPNFGIVLGLLGFTYPVLLLIFMRKPHVVAAMSK